MNGMTVQYRNPLRNAIFTWREQIPQPIMRWRLYDTAFTKLTQLVLNQLIFSLTSSQLI